MDNGGGFTVLISVVVYMGICIFVGLWALRKTKSSTDFFMAGRNLGAVSYTHLRAHETLR